MDVKKLISLLECDPVIAAISDDKWLEALKSPAKVIFYLSADLLTIGEKVQQAHDAGKILMVHMDLAEGIGKDRAGVAYLEKCGADGIISTKGSMIRFAKEQGLVAIQRCFALDSRGLDSIADTLRNTAPHLMEIMPGVIPKAISKFAMSNVPVIAGGLLQTKAEVTEALGAGATAVSTGAKELWYL
ncbi:MAG: glycerol-3-phosphate responsive antiterminator [Oscillospiraceae bacterium]|nr:glycerol-3-phosphate responsive antiterminator [Oscillospiraceae bacterium]